MGRNNFSINLVKIRIKTECGRITKKTQKSVSDTGNPYHVACLSVVYNFGGQTHWDKHSTMLSFIVIN